MRSSRQRRHGLSASIEAAGAVRALADATRARRIYEGAYPARWQPRRTSASRSPEKEPASSRCPSRSRREISVLHLLGVLALCSSGIGQPRGPLCSLSPSPSRPSRSFVTYNVTSRRPITALRAAQSRLLLAASSHRHSRNGAMEYRLRTSEPARISGSELIPADGHDCRYCWMRVERTQRRHAVRLMLARKGIRRP